MKSYIQTLSPHIRSSVSVPEIELKMLLTLTPLLVVACFAFKMKALLIFLSAITGALTAKTLALGLFKRKWTEHTLHALYLGLAFALLLGPETSFLTVLLGAFIAVFLGQELPGGFGACPLNAVCLSFVCLKSLIPFETALISSLTSFSIPSPFWWNSSALNLASVSAAVLSGSLILAFILGLVPVSPFFFFLLGLGSADLLQVQDGLLLLTCPGVFFFAAFILVIDFPSLPMSRSAKNFSVFMTALLGGLTSEPDGFGFFASALIVNAINPWFESITKYSISKRRVL